MTFLVTGGAGFIGSNLVSGLNARGEDDILVADQLQDGQKIHNLADLRFADYVDGDDLLARIAAGQRFGKIRAVFHLGACSTTTEWDGRYLMRNNFEATKTLYAWCQEHAIPFIYASSASVYGLGKKGFREDPASELPINAYAFSKWTFDQWLRRQTPKSQVVGLRYFNVYGPREFHKTGMASPMWHFRGQLMKDGVCKLFEGTDGFKDGEQKRDFVHVDDCVAVNLWFYDHPDKHGIFNVGTGVGRTFNDVAKALIDFYKKGKIEYVPFPQKLVGAYQSYTQADLTALRAAGCTHTFKDVPEGVKRYMEWLER